MYKTKKKNTKRIIALVLIFAVVALLAAMPLIAKNDGGEDGPKASILSDTVSVGSISTELIGGGTIAEEDTISVTVPSSVKLEKFVVSNGDELEKGDVIAKVDRITVMTAVAEVQETLEYLSEQIEKHADAEAETAVTALAGGTVKLVYAEEGESVQDVMLEHGALAVLSLDGLMAIDLTTDCALSVGSTVTVTFSNKTEAEGKIVKNLSGEMTVTVEDDNYADGETAELTDEDGNVLGSGSLYIYSPWNATAYTGTVKSIKAEAGDKLGAGKTLMVLSDTGTSATYNQLITKRADYEELMLELFKMYQTETVSAPESGIVSGIDKNSTQLLSANGYGIDLLANSPDGNDGSLYFNYVGKVTEVAKNGWIVKSNPQVLTVDDYLDTESINTDETLMTQTVLFTDTELPIFAAEDGTWVQKDYESIGAGDILLFAEDSEGAPVWSVLIKESTLTGGNTPAIPEGGAGGSSPDGTGGAISGGFPSAGGISGFPSADVEVEQFELYSLDMTQIASVTPQSTVTLDITIDELDVNALSIGMSATVKINALGGEKYTATVSDIGNVGTNNGGNSKYTVTLTMERTGNILAGMNATATIVLSSQSSVPTVSADAIAEVDGKSVIYTGYDEKSDTLLSPVTVTLGVSDGETVEILDGLESGQTYYYAYYDTPEISFTPDFGNGNRFFGR